MTGFPTSADIYLEMDGKKVAVVQSYTTLSLIHNSEPTRLDVIS